MNRKLKLLFAMCAALIAAVATAQQNVSIVGSGNYILRSPTSEQFGVANGYPRISANQTWSGVQTFGGATIFGGNVTFVSSSISWGSISKSGSSLADLPTRLWSDLQSRPTSVAGLGVTNGAALDSFGALSATGVLVQASPGVYTARTVVSPAAGVTVTNGNGISGNITLALANDLAAYEALSTTGFVVRTADGAATTRSLSGTNNRISVTIADGVSGSPTIDIGTDVATIAGAQTLANKTLDATVGSASELAAIATTGMAVPVIKLWVNSTTLIREMWILKAGTEATDVANGIQRPNDYNASTNAKVWYRAG